jgi:hypothetical protein
MRKLKTSDITTSIAMPIKSGTLDHIQAAYTEAVAEAVKGVVGPNYNSGTMYILNGLVNTGSFPTYNISAGSVFYDGEVYLVDAANFTLAGSQVAVAKIVTTQLSGVNADAVQFTDGIPRNVHDIRKVVLSADLAGSGISNYVSAVRINVNIPQLNLTAGAGISVTGTYPNLQVASTLENPVILATSIFIGDLNSSADLDTYTTLLSGSSNGLAGYRYTFPVAVGHTNYVPILVLQHDFITTVADADANYMCSVQMGQRSATDLYFFIQTTATSNTQNLWLKLILLKSSILYAQ